MFLIELQKLFKWRHLIYHELADAEHKSSLSTFGAAKGWRKGGSEKTRLSRLTREVSCHGRGWTKGKNMDNVDLGEWK